MADTTATSDPTDVVVGFARTLRAAGVAASPDRVHLLVRSLAVLDAAGRDDVYWAGRVTLCGGEDDVERYDRVFAAYFEGVRPQRTSARARPLRQVVVPGDAAGGDSGDEQGDDQEVATVLASASRSEVLRHRDVAALTLSERQEIARLLALMRLHTASRPGRRLQPTRRGRVDRGRTLRELLRRGGEPARLRYAATRPRQRRVVLLVDVSGSMRAYADSLLRFSHAASRRRATPTEVFTIGTRMTRVTRELRHLDPDTALAAVSAAVPDWSGGTRLGELLKEFCDRWGQRGLARGAVVVILSDGWERGDPSLLAEQMARLSRLAYRIVWANPLKARPGYAPLAAGMAAALPYVDDFVEGHSLAALERLARVLSGGGAGA